MTTLYPQPTVQTKEETFTLTPQSDCGCAPTCCDGSEPIATTPSLTHDDIRLAVRAQYGQVALGERDSCGCGPTCCGDSGSAETVSLGLGYSSAEVGQVPDGANMGLGCGNPNAIAVLKSGETVLDLGSGGGFDCFLAAQAVGTEGHVIGVDMTPEMVHKARQNGAAYPNVEFRLGEIEQLPVADGTVDVIISNCVINLSPEKERVFRETFRVLASGGRLAISDVVATADLPETVKRDMDAFTGCTAGASTLNQIEAMLHEAGFAEITVTPKDESRQFIRNWVPNSNIADYILSAHIQAVKPL